MLFGRCKASSLALLLVLLCPVVSSFAVRPSHHRAVSRTPRRHTKRAGERLRPRDGGEACTNGPSSRDCWAAGHDIDTDIDGDWPNTGKTVKYEFTLTNMTLAPDGVPRQVLVANGQYPGPTIEADWGDDIEVTVNNQFDSNGTDIHWHGLRMWGTNTQDGTGGLTECPIAPGGSKTYKWKATQYGTSWWHSHYSVQYGDGIFGAIVIHGPATMNYDIDLGPMTFTDWFHAPIYEINSAQLHAVGPPIGDNMLVNGTMTYKGKGQYGVTYLTPGKSHLLRFINTGINNWVNVALDGHDFNVIASDLVPIVPYKTNTLSIAVGQRYDVVIEADQDIDNYWLRVGTGGGTCDGPNSNAGNIRSIFRYEGADDEDPESEATATLSTGCEDETNLKPWVETTISQETPKEMEITFNNTVVNGQNVVKWLIDDSPMHINLSAPTIQHIFDGNQTFDEEANVYKLGQADTFQYWVIQQNPTNLAAVPHPIHLHGHDFYLLEVQNSGVWDGDTSRLATDNPVRRDTVTLPGQGYIVIAFESDNPGVWLMHCHIPFHASQGFSMQFVERMDDIKGSADAVTDGCEKWAAWREDFYPDGYVEGDTHVKRSF